MFTSAEKLIALRNLKPKKKEGFLKVISIFSFVGIMLGVAILIIVMSVMNGFRTDLTNKILGFNPHITIKPYNEEIIDENFKNKLKKNLPNINILDSFSGEAVVMNKQMAKGIIIKGLDQKNERNKKFLKKVIIEGKKNKIEKGEVILGKQLAIELDLVVGDKINLLSSSFIDTPFGGVPKQDSYLIKAIFNSGFFEFDQSVVFLNLEETLSFFNKNEDFVNLEVYLKNPLKANEIKNKLEEINNNFFIYTWMDTHKSFFGALKVERNVMFIILTLIIIVAAFNIISGLTILVKNKTKEIAILRTLGVSKKSITKVFFVTGFTIGFLATITGVIIGVLFSYYIEEIRILITSIFNIRLFPEEIYFLSQMPSEINIQYILIISFFSLLITFLATIFPSLSAAKLDPIKALKYE